MSVDPILKSPNTSLINARKSVTSKTKTSSKQSVSRSSKASRISKNSIPELSEEEEKQIIVDTIRKEIVENAFEQIYRHYLDRQTVFFVSHCSRLAWKALIEWNYQRKDKGGFKESGKEQLDTEPKPSPKDSWAGHSIGMAQKDDVATMLTKQTPSKSAVKESTVEDEEVTKSLPQVSVRQHKSTISKLPILPPRIRSKMKDEILSGLHDKLQDPKLSELRRESHELPPPVPMQLRNMPSSWVEVKYKVTAGTRDAVNRRALVPKTINLKRKQSPPPTHPTM